MAEVFLFERIKGVNFWTLEDATRNILFFTIKVYYMKCL